MSSFTLSDPLPHSFRVELDRELHLKYLRKGFDSGFPSAYISLDASRPWLVYWALHSFDLLGFELDEALIGRTLETLKTFQVEGEGGFCGGDSEWSGLSGHLAPTYASILALAILASPPAYSLICTPTLHAFLHRLKTPCGAFRMHAVDGEIDVRAVYCAVVVGKLTGCWDDVLEEGVVEWIASCQTWEGGFGGVPGAEAHGGYTFCAISTLSILGKLHLMDNINHSRLFYWLISQQIQPLGGFRGRTHKLVDGCYSFWQAAGLQCLRGEDRSDSPLFDAAALQRYILVACQDLERGGLRDKPGKYNIDDGYRY